jgi:hypothetical protein
MTIESDSCVEPKESPASSEVNQKSSPSLSLKDKIKQKVSHLFNLK